MADTVRGFKEILDGKHDEVPEGNFYMKGGIEEIQESSTSEKGAGETAKAEKPKEAPAQSKGQRGQGSS